MYLLDTNILSELIKKRPSSHVLSQLSSKPAHTLFTSCICIMELRFGSALRNDFDTFWQKINKEILSRINIVNFGKEEALKAGDVLAEMKKAGRSIGIEDVLIAATAITNRLIMVTANVRHFNRIGGLKVENWIEPD